ncbi:hypothetical protein NDU88_003608 [Pleurodeles waltl]|uniref:Uncharacterized protein n=1 Tax=Pleurodeles waltl TaxID=8319 RepID=A0AAV7KZG5_PLEWA|nr:hypothetical protein NDU88_003608 [Pleurodeles waltl]
MPTGCLAGQAATSSHHSPSSPLSQSGTSPHRTCMARLPSLQSAIAACLDLQSGARAHMLLCPRLMCAPPLGRALLPRRPPHIWHCWLSMRRDRHADRSQGPRDKSPATASESTMIARSAISTSDPCGTH